MGEGLGEGWADGVGEGSAHLAGRGGDLVEPGEAGEPRLRGRGG